MGGLIIPGCGFFRELSTPYCKDTEPVSVTMKRENSVKHAATLFTFIFPCVIVQNKEEMSVKRQGKGRC